jgi:hypothetical protein
MVFLIWLKLFVAAFSSSATTVTAPIRSLYRPKFLENELAINSSGKMAATARSPCASSSIPAPKP